MRARVVAAVSVVLLIAVTAAAQFGGPRGPFHEYPNIPYDGQFTFARLKYTHALGGNWYGGWPSWGHGYPLSEQNLMRIMHEVSRPGSGGAARLHAEGRLRDRRRLQAASARRVRRRVGGIRERDAAGHA